MRLTKRLGLGLLLVGAVAILVSSGAFDSIEADRGMELGIAENQSNALLGVSYPNERSVQLKTQNGTPSCYAWIFPTCYRYNNIELMSFKDNTVDGQLSIDDITFSEDQSDSSFTISSGPSYNTNGPGLATVTASFECDGNYQNWQLYQEASSGWVEIDATVSDGNTTVDLTRQVPVNCVAD